MKKIISALVFISFLASCITFKNIPLKGSYPESPIIYYSSKSRDAVWDNIIDLFAQKGISIKIIDKSSGLIISEPINLTFSIEDRKGQLVNKSADVAIYTTISSMTDKPIYPSKVIGEWNIRIKESDGRTAINVNLVNLKHEDAFVENYRTQYRISSYQGNEIRSTGNFEKMISDFIK